MRGLTVSAMDPVRGARATIAAAMFFGVAASGGGTTGTLTATLPAPTVSAAGTSSVDGSVVRTLAAAALAGAGSAPVSGSGAATVSAPTLAAAGAPLVAGAGAATLSAPGLVAAGTPASTGEVWATIVAPVVSGVGSLSVGGALGATLSSPTLSASGDGGPAAVFVDLTQAEEVVPTRRRYLDPQTGDVVLERGSPRSDITVTSVVLMRIRLRRGSSAVAPRLGSRLHTIDRISAQSERLARDYVRECLSDLVERGDVASLVVTSSRPAPNAIGLEVAFRDRSGRARGVAYTHTVT
jgi:phage gp46-like protein